MYDFIVVGSGLFGAVFAQQAREAGRSVLVLEKREHIGGNCFTAAHEDTNILVHRYGSHIFHCNSAAIWNYLNRFTEFNRYRHRVLTTHRDRVYSMPINLGTINAFYNLNLKPHEVGAFLESKRPLISNPRNLEEKAISLIGPELYEAFIKGYTTKQWDCDPRELPASIITRLPVRHSYDDAYFGDTYQGIPVDGYTPIFERMLEGIPVELGVDLFADREHWLGKCRQLVYTGPIDRYFDYSLGRLQWRSVRFEVERLGREDFQGTSVMNYADADLPYTRIHEQKHLHPEKKHTPDTTVIMREFSQVGKDDPYYPVNAPADQELLRKYQELAAEEPNVIFGGRLAEYKYYDMHQVVGAALARAETALKSAPAPDSAQVTVSTPADLPLVLVMPVYNEQDCIVSVIEKWRTILNQRVGRSHMIVLNDGSTDRTGEALRVFDTADAVEVITKLNSGHGPTILQGYRMAVERAEWVFQCDSDDEMPPECFPLLWDKRGEFDALFGYRVDRHQSIRRRMMTLASRAAVRLLFGAGVKDVNTPYRLIRSDVLRPIVAGIADDTFAPNVLIAGELARRGLRILNLPVLHENRKTGSESLASLGLARVAWKALRQTLAYRRRPNG